MVTRRALLQSLLAVPLAAAACRPRTTPAGPLRIDLWNTAGLLLDTDAYGMVDARFDLRLDALPGRDWAHLPGRTVQLQHNGAAVFSGVVYSCKWERDSTGVQVTAVDHRKHAYLRNAHAQLRRI